MSQGVWVDLLRLVGAILLLGLAFIGLASWARRMHDKLGLRPIRRHKSWFVDASLHDKAIRSQREY